MTAKITASADGLKVTIGTAAEDALQIDATAKTMKALTGYGFVLLDFANDSAAAAGGIPIGCLYRTGAIPKCRVA